ISAGCRRPLWQAGMLVAYGARRAAIDLTTWYGTSGTTAAGSGGSGAATATSSTPPTMSSSSSGGSSCDVAVPEGSVSIATASAVISSSFLAGTLVATDHR